MGGLEGFVATYGYAFLVAVGFAEYAGVPIVSVPFVVGAGAMAAGGGLDPFLAAAATGSGAALATSWRRPRGCPGWPPSDS